MGIVDDLYGGGAGGKAVKTPYYGSFQHSRDMQNGVGPPPASQGGPTAFEIYEQEGMLNEGGFLKSNPNVHSITAALYGGGPQELTSQTLNWGAAQQGQTVGGISNTDAMGNPITWGKPQGRAYEEGETFSTPAGDYNVIKNPWGQFALEPVGDASRSNGGYINNMTHGGHHVGINYETGEAWYQGAENIQSDYSFNKSVPQQARLAVEPQSSVRQQQSTAGVSAPVRTQVTSPSAGMLSGSRSASNPEWSALAEAVSAQGMGPFMLGQLAKRR